MYQLVFKNGDIKDLTDEQGQLLLQAFCLGKEKFIFQKALRSFADVKDIKPAKNEADSIYPKLPEIKMTKWTKAKKVKALKSMREGFLKAVDNNLTPNRQNMLENMDRLILRAENEEITTPITSFKEVYGGI